MLTNLVIITGTIAAIVAAVASVKALFPKAKPGIANPKITINVSDFGPYNAFVGSFITDNDGPKLCSLQGVKVSATDLTFEVNAVAERIVLRLAELGRGSGELPMSVNGYEQKTISFGGTHNIRNQEALPRTLNLEVGFNCKTIRQELARVLNTNEYK
jgi:hypothetical protein